MVVDSVVNAVEALQLLEIYVERALLAIGRSDCDFRIVYPTSPRHKSLRTFLPPVFIPNNTFTEVLHPLI